MGTGYPGGVLERLQSVELDILKEVARVCEELGLTWFIDSGTCLGAVRHKGFIPWDDDIDIGLTMDDYRTFCEKAPSMLSREYGLYAHRLLPNYPPLFAKVYRKNTRFIDEPMADAKFDSSIFVDVFAYCQLDSDESVAKRQIRDSALWQRVSYLYNTAHPKIPASVPFKPFFKAACVLAHGVVKCLFSPESIEAHFDAVFARGNARGKWTNAFYSTWGTYETEVLFPVQEVPFEDMTVPAPCDIDVFLTTLYGDYMALPPESERETHLPVVLDFGDGVNVMEGRAGD